MNAPNDSLLWMQYMEFYIHTTEIDKAWAVGQRALKTISFRLIRCKALNFFNVDFVIVLKGLCNVLEAL